MKVKSGNLGLDLIRGMKEIHSPYTHLPHIDSDSLHFYHIIQLADCLKIGKASIIGSEQFQKCCQPLRGQERCTFNGHEIQEICDTGNSSAHWVVDVRTVKFICFMAL